jgi:amino acid permease
MNVAKKAIACGESKLTTHVTKYTHTTSAHMSPISISKCASVTTMVPTLVSITQNVHYVFAIYSHLAFRKVLRVDGDDTNALLYIIAPTIFD